MPMRVVSIAAECEPWAKTGGLADVVDALARALGRLPDRPVGTVEVFLPRYRVVDVPPGTPARSIDVPDPRAPGASTSVDILDVAADGYRLRLVDHPGAFDRAGLYGDTDGDYPDNAWRFGLLCRAALETLRADGASVDVLHLHDWHAGPAAILRGARYDDDPVIGPAAILHTLHNLAYHGWTPRERLGDLGLAPGDGIVPDGADGLDLLRAGIERAELVNTVSPGFAAEALTPGFGMGLDGTLGGLGDRFFGILNGLDTGVWDPATDEVTAARFHLDDLRGKAACRRDLLERMGGDAEDDGPVLGMIGRLDPQKGFDLLADAAPTLLADGARIVVQGNGHATLAEPFRRLAAAHPGRVALIERFDRAMARRIYAGSDLFLMPSRFEPSGQGQMIALRYGTPPVARRTGGLADSVTDAAEHPTTGTGFLFDEAAPEALLEACRRAMRMRRTDPEAWDALVARGMKQDFDWVTGAAPRYLAAYERAVELRRRLRP